MKMQRMYTNQRAVEKSVYMQDTKTEHMFAGANSDYIFSAILIFSGTLSEKIRIAEKKLGKK